VVARLAGLPSIVAAVMLLGDNVLDVAGVHRKVALVQAEILAALSLHTLQGPLLFLDKPEVMRNVRRYPLQQVCQGQRPITRMTALSLEILRF
jgi:hypothetical protein